MRPMDGTEELARKNLGGDKYGQNYSGKRKQNYISHLIPYYDWA